MVLPTGLVKAKKEIVYYNEITDISTKNFSGRYINFEVTAFLEVKRANKKKISIGKEMLESDDKFVEIKNILLEKTKAN